jgi:hypothetical protein
MKHRHKQWFTLIAFLACASISHAQAKPKKVQIFGGRIKDAIDLMVGDELVARYHYGPNYEKPIFWPMNAPGGVPLTRNYPPPAGQADDHPHQKSAWFCHGDVIPEGIELKTKIKGVAGVDFWSEAKGHGKIVCTNAGGLGPVATKDTDPLVTKNEWRTAEGMKIMDEERKIMLYDLGKAYLIVVDIDLHASVCPITFADTKEGAFGVRINDVINAEAARKGKPAGKGKIQNAEGKIGEKDTWGQISNWCDYSGPVEGKEVGLTIFADPKNPYPTCWHVRGYGLMAANPFGRDKHAKFPAMKGNNDPVRLAKGEHLRFRYGMLLHTGDAVSGEVAENYQRFMKLRAKE